jgi:hypothetical protein
MLTAMTWIDEMAHLRKDARVDAHHVERRPLGSRLSLAAGRARSGFVPFHRGLTMRRRELLLI